MADDRTLLAHVVLKLATHPENIAVEALGHILSSSTPTRIALGNLLRAGGAEIGPIARVETQVTGEEGERPDLVGFDDSGAKRLLIEAKFWAGLTESQPVAYLRQLPQGKPSALLFVAPATRNETLWPELRRRVEEAKDIALGPASKEAGLLSATAGGGRRLMLTSWKALLDSMASRGDRRRGLTRGYRHPATCWGSLSTWTRTPSCRCGRTSSARSFRVACAAVDTYRRR